MALSIKSDEADRMARELAEQTDVTITDAVLEALRDRLQRNHDEARRNIGAALGRLQLEVAQLRRVDRRTADEIIGFDAHGAPR